MSEDDILQLAELLDDFIRMDSGDFSAHGRRADKLFAYNFLLRLESYGLPDTRIVCEAKLMLH
jgi:hypothetical protein